MTSVSTKAFGSSNSCKYRKQLYFCLTQQNWIIFVFTYGVFIEVTARYNVKYRSLGERDGTNLYWLTSRHEEQNRETKNLHDFFFHVSVCFSPQLIWIKTENHFVLRTSYKGQVLTYLCLVLAQASYGAHWNKSIDVSWASLHRNPCCNVCSWSR